MISEFLLAVQDISGWFSLEGSDDYIFITFTNRVFIIQLYGRNANFQFDIVDTRHKWAAEFSVSIIPDVPRVVDNQIIGH